MGCGAVCGDNTSIYQPNQYSLQIFLKLIPQLHPNNNLISQKEYHLFITQIKQNPQKYRLKINTQLLENQSIDSRILKKWKIILFCHDNQNQRYIDCLGFNQIKNAQKFKQPIFDQNIQDQNDYKYKFDSESKLKEHDHFSSIRKDIDRTSNIPQNKKKQFQNILKRITNHFPGMGYTQGMNFLIAFFLKIGYSQFDAFWIFVHIAINKRFLLLGFFQDTFPLQKHYQIIFKNILKRQNPNLYHHLYEYLNFPQDQWLIKWFITFFHYSFPIEIVTYVFDILIDIGSVGLVTFSFGIVQELSQLIFQQNQATDLFYEFAKLKNIQFFNQNINLKKAIQKAYKVRIIKQDFQGIVDDKQSFYSHYILTKLQEDALKSKNISMQKTQLLIVQGKSQQISSEQLLNNHHYQMKSQKILEKWYEQLINQRQKFLNPNCQINKKIQRISIEGHFDNIREKNQVDQIIIGDDDNQEENKNSVKDSMKDSVEMKNHTNPSTGYSFNKKSSRIKNADLNSQIDQLWDQEDETNSYISKNISSRLSQQSRSQQGFDSKIHKPKYQDELDKLAVTQNVNKFKNNSNYEKSSTIFVTEQLGSLKPRINNYQSPATGTLRSTFMRAGSNILNDYLIKNKLGHDQAISQSSKNSIYRERKQKQNDINLNKSKNNIIGGIIQSSKMKTQGKKSINDDLSEHDSSIDPRNSIYASNQSIQEQIRNQHGSNEAYSMKAFDSRRQKLATHQDILVNSLEASKIIENNSKHYDSIQSEIQIFQANHGFKKKNRVSSRVSGGVSSAVNQNLKRLKMTHNISDINIGQKGEKILSSSKMLGIDLNYEQSCESFYTTSRDVEGNNASYKSVQKYQIESVK